MRIIPLILLLLVSIGFSSEGYYDFFLRKAEEPKIEVSKKELYKNLISFDITFGSYYSDGEIVQVYLINKDTKQESFIQSDTIDSQSVSVFRQFSNIAEGEYFIRIDKLQNVIDKQEFENVIIKLISERKDPDIQISNIDFTLNVAYTNIVINVKDQVCTYDLFYKDNQDHKIPINGEINGQATIDLDKNKGEAAIIIYGSDGSIKHIINEVTVIDGSALSASKNYRVVYITNESDLQEISVELLSNSQGNIDYLSLVSSVSIVGMTKKKVIPLSKDGNKYSNKVVLSSEYADSYMLNFELLNQVIEYPTNGDTFIYMTDSIFDIIRKETFTLSTCLYQGISKIQVNMERKKSNIDLQLAIQQKDKKEQFSKTSSLYTYTMSAENKLEIGEATITIVDKNALDIPLYTQTIYLTGMSVEEPNDPFPPMEYSLSIKELLCDATQGGYYLENIETKEQIKVTCSQYSEGTMKCSWNGNEENHEGGKYELKLSSGEALYTISLYKEFTEEIQVVLPEDVKIGDNTLSLSIPQEGALQKVQQITIRKGADTYLTYHAPPITDQSLTYFAFDKTENPTSIDMIVNVEKASFYVISQIIFSDYHRKDITSEDMQLVNLLDIKNRYYVVPQIELNQTVELDIEEIYSQSKYKNLGIYLKKEGTTQKLECEESAQKLTCNLNFYGFTQPTYVLIGVGENFLSSKKINLLIYSIPESCFVELETDASKTISLTISSSEAVNIIEATMTQTTGMGDPIKNANPVIEENGKKTIFNLEVGKTKPGSSYSISITIGEFEIPLLGTSIKQIKNYKVEDIQIDQNILYWANKGQKFQIIFSDLVLSSDIKGIQLTSGNSMFSFNNLNEGSFQEMEFEFNESVLEENFVSGTYELSYISECGNKINLGKKVEIRYNKINSITPISHKLGDEAAKFTVEYEYPFGTETELSILFSYAELNSYTFPFTPVSTSKTSEITVSDIEAFNKLQEGKYKVQTQLKGTSDESDVYIYIYKNSIELAFEKKYELVSEETTVTIQLKNPIFLEQIKKITASFSPSRPLTDYELSEDKKSILIKNTKILSSKGEYSFTIEENNNDSSTCVYTVIVTEEVDLLKADITVKLSPVKESIGEQLVFEISSLNYDMDRVIYVEIEKYDKYQDSENLSKTLKYCPQGSAEENCSGEYTIEKKETDLIVGNISREKSEGCNFKYYVKNIAESTTKVRQFKPTEHYYEDCHVFDSISVVEMFPYRINEAEVNIKSESSVILEEIKEKINFLNLEQYSCTKACDITSLVMTCKVSCGTQINKVFDIKFTVNEEPESPVYYIHFITVDELQDGTKCQSVEKKQDVVLSLNSENKLHSLSVNINEVKADATIAQKLDETSNIYITKITISKDKFTLETEPYIYIISLSLNEKNQKIATVSFDNSVFNDLIEGELKAQIETDQTIKVTLTFFSEKEYSFYLKINGSKISPKKTEVTTEASTKVYALTFDMAQNKQTGTATLYYILNDCDAFDSGKTISISKPPKEVSSMLPKGYKVGTDPIKVTFTLKYTLSSEETVKSITMQKDNANSFACEGISLTEKTISCTVASSENFLEGFYDFIITFADEEKPIKSGNFLVYVNDIKFKNEEEVRLKGIDLKGTKFEFLNLIIKEQVSKIIIGDESSNIEFGPEDYTFNPSYIILNIEYTLTKDVALTVEDPLGNTASVRIKAINSVVFEECEISFDIPEMDVNGKKNFICLSSNNYNLDYIDEIQVINRTLSSNKYTEFTLAKKNKDFVYHSNNNTLTFELFLNETEDFEFTSIKSGDKEKTYENVYLRGYIPDNAVIIEKNDVASKEVSLRINFYDPEKAYKYQESIYIENEKVQCEPSEEGKIDCSFKYEKEIPSEIKVKVTESGDERPVQLAAFEPQEDYCFKSFAEKTILFKMSATKEINQIRFFTSFTGATIKPEITKDETTLSYTILTDATKWTSSNKLSIKVFTYYSTSTFTIPVKVIPEFAVASLETKVILFKETERELKFKTESAITREAITKVQLKGKEAENSEKVIDLSSCSVEEDQLTVICKFTLAESDLPGKYEFIIVNGCGAEEITNLEVELVKGFNAINEINPTYYKLGETTEITVTYLEPVAQNEDSSEAITKLEFILKKDNAVSFSVEKAQLTATENLVKFSLNNNEIQEGIYNIKTNFKDTFVNSGIDFLVYRNDIELKETSKETNLAEYLGDFDIPLVNPIIEEQIQSVKYKREKNLKDDFKIFEKYTLSSEETPKIAINIADEKEIIDSNILFVLTDFKDQEHNFSIFARKALNYSLLTEVSYFNITNRMSDIYIDLGSIVSAVEYLDDFYIDNRNEDPSNQLRKLQCKEFGDKDAMCEYDVSSKFNEMFDSVVQYKEFNISDYQAPIWFTYYDFRPYYELTEKNLEKNLLQAFSAKEIDIYFNDKKCDLTPIRYLNNYIYTISLKKFNQTIEGQEGIYKIYGQLKDQMKVQISSSYYYITPKKVLSVSTLYATSEPQELQIVFETKLVENEVASVSLKTEQNLILFVSDSCKQADENVVNCSITLTDHSFGQYSLFYTNIKLDNVPQEGIVVEVIPKLQLKSFSPLQLNVREEGELVLEFDELIQNYEIGAIKLEPEEPYPTYNKTFEIYSVDDKIVKVKFGKDDLVYGGNYKVSVLFNGSLKFYSIKSEETLVLFNKNGCEFTLEKKFVVVEESKCDGVKVGIKVNCQAGYGVEEIKTKEGEIALTKNSDTEFSYTLQSCKKGDVSFTYKPKGSEIYVDIPDSLSIVNDYQEIFSVESTASSCSLVDTPYVVNVKPVGAHDLENIKMILKSQTETKSIESKKGDNGFEFSFSVSSTAKGRVDYEMIIADNAEGTLPMYSAPLQFTSITPPKAIYSSDSDIIFTNVYCSVQQKDLKLSLTQGKEISIPVLSAEYSSSTNSLSCKVEKALNNLFGTYSVNVNQKELGSTFISKPLSTATFSLLSKVIAENTITLTSTNYYMENISELSVKTVNSEVTNTVTQLQINTSSNQVSFTFTQDRKQKYFISALKSKDSSTKTFDESSDTNLIFQFETKEEDKGSVAIIQDTLYTSSKSSKLTFQLNIKNLSAEEVSKIELNSQSALCTINSANNLKADCSVDFTYQITINSKLEGDINKVINVIYYSLESSCLESTEGIKVRIECAKGYDYSQKLTVSIIDTQQTATPQATQGTQYQSIIYTFNTLTPKEYQVKINDQILSSKVTVVGEIPVSSITEALISAEGTLKISLSQSATQSDIPKAVTLQKNDGQKYSTNICKLETTQKGIECTFSPDLKQLEEGEYSLFFTTKCSQEKIAQVKVKVAGQEQFENIVSSIEPNTVLLSAAETIKLTLNTNACSKVKALVLKSNSQEKEFSPECPNESTLNLKLSSIQEGLYEVEFIIAENSNKYSQGKQVLVYSNAIEAVEKEISIQKDTKLSAVSIELKNPIFKEQISKVEYKEEGETEKELTFGLQSNKITISSELVITKTASIIITEVLSNKKEEIKITVTTPIPVSLKINAHVFLYKGNNKPKIEITAEGVKEVFIVRKGKKVTLQKNSQGIFEYDPMSKVEVFIIGYTDTQGKEVTTEEKAYVINDITDLIKFSALQCSLEKEDYTVHIENPLGVSLDYLKFKLYDGANYITYESVYEGTSGTYSFKDKEKFVTQGTFILQIMNDADKSLYEQQVKFTDASNSGCTYCKDLYHGGNCIATCPEGYQRLGRSCFITCPKVVENGVCRDICEEGYGLGFEEMKKCYNCKELSEFYYENECVIQCPQGFTMENNICKALKPSSYEKCKEQNYCVNGECSNDSETYNGDSDKICQCRTGYIGVRCDTKKEEISDNVEKIISYFVSNQKVNNDDFDKGKIDNLVLFLEESPESLKTISDELKTSFVEWTINFVQKDDQDLDVNYSLKLLTLATMIEQSTNKKKEEVTSRRLQEAGSSSLKEIISSIITLNKRIAKTNKSTAYQDLAFGYYRLSRVLLKKDDMKQVSQAYEKISKGRNSAYVELMDCEESIKDTTEGILFIITEASSNVTSSLLSDTSDAYSSFIFLDALNSDNTDASLEKCQNLKAHVPTTVADFNQQLASIYLLRGINVYNSLDPAFNEVCYKNSILEYDTTRNYRVANIYQNKELGPSDESCKVSLENGNYALVECPFGKPITTIPSPVSFTFNEKLITVPSLNIHSLPFRCGSKAGTVEKNPAFWITIILTLLLGGYILFVIVLGEFKVFVLKAETALANDEIASRNVPKQDNGGAERTFLQIFLKNLFKLHPVMSIFFDSFITPITLTSVFLYSNLILTFGFNALFFDNGYIEKRIYYFNRNSFDYPFVHEFPKIIYTILLLIGFNLIIKLICFISFTRREELDYLLDMNKSKEERTQWLSDHLGQLRRIISISICVILSVFFSFYSILFCDLHVNTQAGWAYSSIWTLLIIWVLLAPGLIAGVSLVEKHHERIGYYCKQLFIF